MQAERESRWLQSTSGRVKQCPAGPASTNQFRENKPRQSTAEPFITSVDQVLFYICCLKTNSGNNLLMLQWERYGWFNHKLHCFFTVSQAGLCGCVLSESGTNNSSGDAPALSSNRYTYRDFFWLHLERGEFRSTYQRSGWRQGKKPREKWWKHGVLQVPSRHELCVACVWNIHVMTVRVPVTLRVICRTDWALVLLSGCIQELSREHPCQIAWNIKFHNKKNGSELSPDSPHTVACNMMRVKPQHPALEARSLGCQRHHILSIAFPTFLSSQQTRRKKTNCSWIWILLSRAVWVRGGKKLLMLETAVQSHLSITCIIRSAGYQIYSMIL